MVLLFVRVFQRSHRNQGSCKLNCWVTNCERKLQRCKDSRRWTDVTGSRGWMLLPLDQERADLLMWTCWGWAQKNYLEPKKMWRIHSFFCALSIAIKPCVGNNCQPLQTTEQIWYKWQRWSFHQFESLPPPRSCDIQHLSFWLNFFNGILGKC